MESDRYAELTAEYERTKRAYLTAVDHFFTVGYLATDAEHSRLKAAVDDARRALDIAQQEMETAQAESKGSGHGAAKSAP
jgi:Cdc6-like AAA superfamily ATPase